MAGLAPGEQPLREPFWSFAEPGEERAVDRLLRRRFPDTYRRLAAALEQADPMDVVYPGNPGEYDDVVREILVLLAGAGGSVDGMPVDELAGLIEEGLARRFGEPADDRAVRRAAELLAGAG
ncbi:hypothetical protein [Jidongwangia harbinensis]|uniref:hypothetical protein n=1 Tax=Jidongwangia harbinensis TaxID=2878561 RepID=UPI001CDA3396|nr:hypothetical protein [Jidongwangia harbinensis]MCA2211586.1 hypothetical protein [Jidongwangia harbinensis]